MIEKAADFENKHIYGMDNDAKTCVNSDTLHPENSSYGVLGRPVCVGGGKIL